MKRELLIDCHTGTQDLPALLLVSRVKDAEIRALTSCYDPDRPVADIQDLQGVICYTFPHSVWNIFHIQDFMQAFGSVPGNFTTVKNQSNYRKKPVGF